MPLRKEQIQLTVNKIYEKMLFMQNKGRFAPSPSGRMHLGNIYTAIISYLRARSQNASWILRIEDIDRQRCKSQYTELLLDDLKFLGLDYDELYIQSQRINFYQKSFENLQKNANLYECFCRRQDIFASSAPHASDGKIIYSGRCKHLNQEQRDFLHSQGPGSTRIEVPDEELSFLDAHYGLQKSNLAKDCGDFIIRRADNAFSYQLAVVTDDGENGVTEVVRARDLIDSTFQQIFLYKCLKYPEPSFFHIPLLITKEGRRLSKRDKDCSMEYLRKNYSSQEIIALVLNLAGMLKKREGISLQEAISIFNPELLPKKDIVVPTSLE